MQTWLVSHVTHMSHKQPDPVLLCTTIDTKTRIRQTKPNSSGGPSVSQLERQARAVSDLSEARPLWGHRDRSQPRKR